MKSLKDLKSRGIEITPELMAMVLDEVTNRMTGGKDGILHEPLGQIIANQYTVIKLKKELCKSQIS